MSGSKAGKPKAGAAKKRPTQRRPLQLALRTRRARLALLGFVLLAVVALVAGILIPGSIGTARPNMKPDVLSCPAAKTVTVTSEPRRGTEFQVDLPAAEEEPTSVV